MIILRYNIVYICTVNIYNLSLLPTRLSCFVFRSNLSNLLYLYQLSNLMRFIWRITKWTQPGEKFPKICWIFLTSEITLLPCQTWFSSNKSKYSLEWNKNIKYPQVVFTVSSVLNGCVWLRYRRERIVGLNSHWI